jgi:hypothetical protein
MQISTEIYDLVRSLNTPEYCLVMTNSDPTQIILYVEIDENTGTGHWQHDVRHYKGLVARVRQRLAEVRLVNKAFYDSVSPRLFRHVGVRPRLSNSSAKRRSAFFRLEKISESKYAEYVRGIDFWFHLSSQGRADRDYVSDLMSLLRPCLARFKNIRMLGFHEPHSDLSERPLCMSVVSLRCFKTYHFRISKNSRSISRLPTTMEGYSFRHRRRKQHL